jgi:hypothetical protein
MWTFKYRKVASYYFDGKGAILMQLAALLGAIFKP